MPGSALQAMRADVARAHKSGDVDRIQTSRRDLAAAKIAAYVERVVADAPPLTAAQRDQLASLLTLGGEAA